MTAVFGRISAVIDRRYSLTRRTERDAIAKCRQSQGRSVTIRNKVKEVVVRIEELRGVVAGTRAAAGSEIAVRFDARAVAARDVVRHQIDDRLQSMGMESRDELLEFGQSRRRICRIVRTD